MISWQKLKKRAGFTLIEIITTLFIMSLLMLLVLPNINHLRQFAQEKQKTAFRQTIRHQVALYKEHYPDEPALTTTNMQAKGYLTAEQVRQIERDKIVLDDNK
ncbi:competence protein ComGC [Weissella uvarum]|uniref:competence type IV pilus major pilin ComGC n=1 Tax=Weissella uvarum TaxID=1479233 RepID=UPI00195FD0B2|nr:prepilin-type N-terminal cleavage/methylation domain-containing protein [Weissella uvarum]MBM7617775.1 competence protein ComGC [Weissella uvarum]MCM0595846.1 prepilin-type N-terminal cleavage/methylation domain-containing protein [Weissella uvarum]